MEELKQEMPQVQFVKDPYSTISISDTTPNRELKIYYMMSHNNLAKAFNEFRLTLPKRISEIRNGLQPLDKITQMFGDKQEIFLDISKLDKSKKQLDLLLV